MPGELSPSDVLIRTEKLEAKLETINANITGTQDRISRLSEEIGELRAMIIEREKKFTDIETEFEKIKGEVSVIRPQTISKNIESFETRLTKIDAQIEKNGLFITKLSEEIKEFRTRLKSIQSLENVAEVMKKVQEKAADVEQSKRHATRMAAKAEKMFLELDKRLPELEKSMDRIAQMEEVNKDLIKITDELSIKLKTAIHREDLEKVDLEIADRLVAIEQQLKTGVPRLSEEDKEIDIPKVKEGAPVGKEFKAEDIPVEEIDIPSPEGIPEVPSPTKKETPKIGKTIPDMIKEARGYLKLGGHSTAKNLYDKVLAEYKDMEVKQPLKAKEYYKEINKLYKDLIAHKKA
jgi:DNA repair exonuclease SbcCD ATPase subunit